MLVLLKCSICAPLVELCMFRVLSFVGDRFNLSVHCYSANLLDIFYPSLVCHPILISHWLPLQAPQIVTDWTPPLFGQGFHMWLRQGLIENMHISRESCGWCWCFLIFNFFKVVVVATLALSLCVVVNIACSAGVCYLCSTFWAVKNLSTEFLFGMVQFCSRLLHCKPLHNILLCVPYSSHIATAITSNCNWTDQKIIANLAMSEPLCLFVSKLT